VVDWKAIPWEIRPVAGSDHPVLFVRTARGQEACFGPVEIRGDIVFVSGGPVPSLTLEFQGVGGATGVGVFAEKRHFVEAGMRCPQRSSGWRCARSGRGIGVKWGLRGCRR
jgi:hypothetical protein